ncbi:unnamed protein product, partial [Staurois parvus]
MVGMDLELPETRSWLLGAPVSGSSMRKGLPHGEESDVRRSEDPAARDGWMDEQGQTGRVGNREGGKVQAAGIEWSGPHARSATAGKARVRIGETARSGTIRVNNLQGTGSQDFRMQ